MESGHRREVVITGIGVEAPGGHGREQFLQRILDGRTATRTITAFDPTGYRSQIGAECDVALGADRTGTDREDLDRTVKLALASAREAIEHSGLSVDASTAPRAGVSLGSAVGCTIQLEKEYRAVSGDGSRWQVDHTAASPSLYEHFVPSSMAAEIARSVNAAGPVALVSAGCTSGLDALGHACEIIREGSADVMISGGTDAPISPITVACFVAIRATSPRNDNPATALRPFDRNRNGFVFGEGAAVLVLEELTHAREHAVNRDAITQGRGQPLRHGPPRLPHGRRTLIRCPTEYHEVSVLSV